MSTERETRAPQATEARERAKAAAKGQQKWGWEASAADHARYAQPLPSRYRNRRKCSCGCGGKETHVGCANGLGLMSGCEWAVRLWVRDGY